MTNVLWCAAGALTVGSGWLAQTRPVTMPDWRQVLRRAWLVLAVPVVLLILVPVLLAALGLLLWDMTLGWWRRRRAVDVHEGATEEFGQLLDAMVLDIATEPAPAVLAVPGDPYAALAVLAPAVGFDIVCKVPVQPPPWNRRPGLHRAPEPLALGWLRPTELMPVLELAEVTG